MIKWNSAITQSWSNSRNILGIAHRILNMVAILMQAFSRNFSDLRFIFGERTLMYPEFALSLVVVFLCVVMYITWCCAVFACCHHSLMYCNLHTQTRSTSASKYATWLFLTELVIICILVSLRNVINELRKPHILLNGCISYCIWCRFSWIKRLWGQSTSRQAIQLQGCVSSTYQASALLFVKRLHARYDAKDYTIS